MEYKLAKELKDAGFPQHGWNVITPTTDEKAAGRDVVKYPLLEELIEACGDDFRALNLTLLPSERWHAAGVNVSTVNVIDVFHGATPTIAVAKLWLALNSTPKQPREDI